MDESRALVSDPVLWPRVRDFLWDFAPQVHESWLSDIPGLSETAGNSGVFGNPRVKRYILDSLGVKPCFHFFPKDDGSRLLLLDGATLESTVKWLGALVCADSLRLVTDGATVRALKAALPGVYPEVFGYTAYFKSKVESLKVEGLKPNTVAVVGWMILRLSLSRLPESLMHRLSLKLPKDLEQQDFRPLTSDFQLSTLQLLLRLRFPEAYKICC